MESYILLHNNFYKHCKPLISSVKKLLEKIHIPIVRTESLALDEKFLPFITPVEYFKPLILLLDKAQQDGHKVLVCDSQSLLVITRLLKNLYENTELREELAKACAIDILNLENSFVFAPEVLVDRIPLDAIKHRRWEGL